MEVASKRIMEEQIVRYDKSGPITQGIYFFVRFLSETTFVASKIAQSCLMLLLLLSCLGKSDQ